LRLADNHGFRQAKRRLAFRRLGYWLLIKLAIRLAMRLALRTLAWIALAYRTLA
jgi:hypothetical protein